VSPGQEYRVDVEISAKRVNMPALTNSGFTQTYRNWTRIPQREIITVAGEVDASGLLAIEWKGQPHQIAKSDLDTKCSPTEN
jgi:hypothetical protein